MLARYGAETAEIRVQFRLLVETGVNRIWPPQSPVQADLKPREDGKILVDELRLLAPKSDAQAQIKNQVLGLIAELQNTQWLLFLKIQAERIAYFTLIGRRIMAIAHLSQLWLIHPG